MRKYLGFGQYSPVEKVEIYTTAQHLESVEEYPTRRKRINSIKRGIEHTEHATETIARQLTTSNHFAYFQANKFTTLDLYDLERDLKNQREALTILEATK